MGKYPEVYTSIGKLPQKLVSIEGGEQMFWLNIFLSLREAKRRSNLIHPKERYVWVQVRILRETNKAALVDNGMRIWIPKSWIYGIRLRSNTFEVYIEESTFG